MNMLRNIEKTAIIQLLEEYLNETRKKRKSLYFSRNFPDHVDEYNSLLDKEIQISDHINVLLESVTHNKGFYHAS